ncbi:MAG: hypothetical protein WC935_08150 [Thermoleophilia bacterium]
MAEQDNAEQADGPARRGVGRKHNSLCSGADPTHDASRSDKDIAQARRVAPRTDKQARLGIAAVESGTPA